MPGSCSRFLRDIDIVANEPKSLMFGDRETDENNLIYKTICGGISSVCLVICSVAYLVFLILKMINPMSFTWSMMLQQADMNTVGLVTLKDANVLPTILLMNLKDGPDGFYGRKENEMLDYSGLEQHVWLGMVDANGVIDGNETSFTKGVQFVKCSSVETYKSMLEQVKKSEGSAVSEHLLCPPDWASADFKIGGKFDMRRGNSSAMLYATRTDNA